MFSVSNINTDEASGESERFCDSKHCVHASEVTAIERNPTDESIFLTASTHIVVWQFVKDEESGLVLSPRISQDSVIVEAG